MKYKITFFDFWHLGSGQSAGARVDALVVKDEFGLPYLPGKTLKGLLRQMCEYIDSAKTKEVFGAAGEMASGAYFSNATLKEEQISYLSHKKELIRHLYSSIAQTKINKDGVSQDNSLRVVEVVIPLELFGYIKTSEKELVKQGLKMIKQIGLSRNRGLGRCKIEVIDEN